MITHSDGLIGGLQQAFEHPDVELIRLHSQRVSGSLAPYPVVPEQLAQPVNIRVERGGRAARRGFAPECIDQPVTSDDLVRVQQHNREERPLLAAAQRDGAPPLRRLQRAEHPEPHGPM